MNDLIIVKKSTGSRAEVDIVPFQTDLSTSALIEGLSTIIKNRWSIDMSIPSDARLSSDLSDVLLGLGWHIYSNEGDLYNPPILDKFSFFFILNVKKDQSIIKSGEGAWDLNDWIENYTFSSIYNYIISEIISHKRNTTIENIINQ
jgi:hypothetical protein